MSGLSNMYYTTRILKNINTDNAVCQEPWRYTFLHT